MEGAIHRLGIGRVVTSLSFLGSLYSGAYIAALASQCVWVVVVAGVA